MSKTESKVLKDSKKGVFMQNTETLSLSPLALAFMGDAVHTTYVRERVLQKPGNMNSYHNKAKKFCNAGAQAKMLLSLQSALTEEEKEIVRKARNAHNKHSAKNYDEETYKKATAFEALIGWLHLTQQTTRLHEVLDSTFESLEKELK